MEEDQNSLAKRANLAKNQVAPHQPPPPQKCPRCESLNTKFCYYNNYNLGQPRYFCKGCRRYWTHGGTLRNVPVGGGCRKGRRGRVSPISCGESSRSRPSQQPPPPLPQPSQQPQIQFSNVTNMAAMVSGIAGLSANQSLRSISWAHPPVPGGIFAAFEGMQNMPPLSQTQGINNQPILSGTRSGAGANMPIFSGFNFSSMKSQQDQAQPLEIQQLGQFDGIGNRNKNKELMYTPADENLVLPEGNLNSWTRGDNVNTIASTSNSNLWNNSNRASTSTSMTDQSSFNKNEWPNFPYRFDPPQ